jgi:ribonucleoside-triphosphate reductase
MQVSKRDGTIVEFDINKIRIAISKTNEQTQEMESDDLDRIVGIIERKIQRFTGEISVEDIQDLVEDTLLKSKFNRTAKSYVLYRDMRSRNRDNRSKLLKEIAKKLNGTNIVNQNANVDEASFGGRKGEANNELLKWYALNNCMSKRSRDNHLNNEVYQHDLDSYAVGMHNCLSVPFDKLLSGGFNTRQTDIRPASSINTAFQLVAVIFQLQSLQQFGGVSATHLDWTMVPFVRKSLMKHYIFEYLKDSDDFYNLELETLSDEELDQWIQDHKAEYLEKLGLSAEDFFMGSATLDTKLYKKALFETRRETMQAVEGMYHNLNTLQSRSGNQLPFTSINYGTCVLPEGRLIINAILEGSIKGVGKHHRTAIFPCGIFVSKAGVNRKPGDPNYDLFRLALKSTAKRLYPNYGNGNWSVNTKAFDKDRADKINALNALSEDDRVELLKRVLANPEIAEALMLDVKDQKLEVSMVERPIEQFSTMGCRTSNGFDVWANDSYVKNLRKVISEGKLYDDFVSANQKDGRGNICPVTIILPTLAMEAGRNVDCFMALLDAKLKDAKDMLIERFNFICTEDAASAKFMYENGTMSGYVAEEGIKSALRHGTLAIGQLGLAETLELLVGCNQTKPEGMALAREIEGLFMKRVAEFKEQYKLNFGVYYTPKHNF